jgi:2-polyprenyl-6-methoxyphenol hydroxylase-like FAD-dependent oxidoreductase
MNTATQKKVLISGASFAGLSTAYWMNKFGYQVTIVEIAPASKEAAPLSTF